jgi:hypothetical protein
MATASATRSIAPVKKNTPRHPKISPITPEPDAPSRFPPDRNLPLLYRNPVTGNSQCNRENAARGGACDDAQSHQCLEIRGQTAGKCCHANNQHAKRDQSCFAEHVGKSAEYRLDERIGQGEAR